jgi:hypothetical protein
MIPVAGITEAAVENRYAALVRGPSAIFPRGFLWLVPVWYAALAALMEIKGRPPSWYAPIAVGGLLLGALTLLTVLTTIRNNAFLADEDGIWLGLRGGARRRFGRRRRDCRQLPWRELQQLKIARRHYGARLEITLLPECAPHQGRIVWRAIAALLTLLIPAAYLFRSPGLLRPRSHSLRYRIPLYDVRPEQLRMALEPLAPPTLPIVVLPRWPARAMKRLRRSRLATAA